MNKIRLYLQEAYSELLYKVTWPTWTELQGSAVVVLIAVLLLALTIFVMDQGSNSILKFYYHLFD